MRGTPRVVINRVISEQLDATESHAQLTSATDLTQAMCNAAAQQGAQASPASIACNGLIIPDSAVTL